MLRIGYACLNSSLEGFKMMTFRLGSYSDERLRHSVANNLEYTRRMLLFNVEHDIRFFRISSDLVPFASHEVCTVPWQREFAEQFAELGKIIKAHGLRISMHPDQFVLINSPSEAVFQNSVQELTYHADMFALLGLDVSHKLQIHVGGVYGDKAKATERFIERFNLLPTTITARLVIENDDRLFSLRDCLVISEQTNIPILFDIFHHQCLNHGESIEEALRLAADTWQKKDGRPMIDYSSQAEGRRLGAHTDSADLEDFKKYAAILDALDMDVMLEVKDKEKSVLRFQHAL